MIAWYLLQLIIINVECEHGFSSSSLHKTRMKREPYHPSGRIMRT